VTKVKNFQVDISKNLANYKRKKLLRLWITGLLITISASTLLYLGFGLLEGVGHFGPLLRGLLFFAFAGITLFLLIKRVVIPLYWHLHAEKAISDETAAEEIGGLFPEIKDKLLNYVQLLSKQFNENDLARASIKKREQYLRHFTFTEAIEKKTLQTHVNYLWPLLLLATGLSLAFPRMFLTSNSRIVHFYQQFVPVTPFTFHLSSSARAFRNEDYRLEINMSGESLPNEAFLLLDQRQIRLTRNDPMSYSFVFPNIQASKTFRILAAGFQSKLYTVEVVDRASLKNFHVTLNYPPYLHQKSGSLENIGNFEVPEGTKVLWELRTDFTNKLEIFLPDETLQARNDSPHLFAASKVMLATSTYEIGLSNEYGAQKGTMQYVIKVIKDEFPKIQVNVVKDTALFSFVALAGNISDDHGIRSLSLHYSKNEDVFKKHPLSIDRGLKNQSFFYQWILDSLGFRRGDKLRFYLQIKDNDGVNGSKSTKSALYELAFPDQTSVNKLIEQTEKKTGKDLDKASDHAKNLKNELEELSDRLKSKKKLDWEDLQKLNQIIRDREDVNKQIKDLQKQNELLNEQQKQFNKPSESIQEKQEQLQKLMDELLDDETKKLYEELQELLKDYENADPIQDILNQLKNKEVNLDQELSRAVELFKRLKVEQKLEETVRKLEELSNQQDSLANATESKQNSYDSLSKSQEKLNEEFDRAQKEIDKTKQLNQDLKHPNSMINTSGDEEKIKELQKQAKESIDQHKRKKSKNAQKGASQQLEELSQKMEKMQVSMQSQQMQENINDLKMILKNLITLSFGQEEVMDGFRSVKPNDPRFVTLSEDQLSLQDDAKIVEDSLIALANRVSMLGSFITREMNEMKTQMQGSMEYIRARKKAEALSKQQLSMTSMNNLALMLDNSLQQMMAMANSMGKGGDTQPQNLPSMSEMQKRLNQEIRELQQSGKSGRQLSEELAKLAAEQERIRKALKQAEEKMGEKPGDINKLMKQMEDTEVDLVNKNLTKETINRQKKILTRLLEAEKSMRERELDRKRESKTAKQYDKVLPAALKEYLKQREKEVELLNTVPTRLLPYYKDEVYKYFERLKEKTYN